MLFSEDFSKFKLLPDKLELSNLIFKLLLELIFEFIFTF